MIVEWDTEEYYPVYEIRTTNGSWPTHEIVVSDELFSRYNAAMQEFWAVQGVIRRMIEERTP